MNFFANPKLVGAIALPLVMMLLVLSFVFTATDRDTLAEATPATLQTPPVQKASVETEQEDAERKERANRPITSEVIWLARVIYSETKRPYEQELVAWVVRNRVETRYRRASTYQQVVLDPWQFSAFNRNSPKRRHYSNLGVNSQAAGWQTAMNIARDVYYAESEKRPFVKTTRHFYSERSMVGRRAPAWANGKRPVSLDRNIDPRRFRFFANIA
jgi:hypothetical protein